MNIQIMKSITQSIFALSLLASFGAADVSFEEDVNPILAKYCTGCHNDDDKSGEFSMSSFSKLQAGGESGQAILPGDSASSRLIQLMSGDADPQMPPEDEPQPTAADLEILRIWIDQGAAGPSGSEFKMELRAPQINPSLAAKPITAIAFSPNDDLLAIARYGDVEIRTADGRRTVGILRDHAGKVNAMAFLDSRRLIVASGVTGLRGEIRIWDITARKVLQQISGHRDTIYSVAIHPSKRYIASAGYDRDVILWDLKSGAEIRRFEGHNGAIFDLDFTPNGKLLASASADATVKIWNVDSGQRMDTLSQPLKEQYSVEISPDGKSVFACGEDNRIRKWNLISYQEAKINPIEIARFGHEASVDQIELTNDGRFVISVSADRTLKIWDADGLTQQFSFDKQSDSVQAVAINASSSKIVVGRMDGSIQLYDLPDEQQKTTGIELAARVKPAAPLANPDQEPIEVNEREPNNVIAGAQPIQLPAMVTGHIHANTLEAETDIDLFRFFAKAGDEWVFEVRASRDKSPLDSHIAILDSQGEPVPRVLLQAVRDSYFTFRGKDSRQTGDFRLHNWQEMRLNQYLYASGEVIKLFHYPRGPDSGFNAYPNFGNRHAYFDTTSVAHALGEPCYIVQPLEVDAAIVPNGLPVFPIFFENDDESRQQMGDDSRLTFTAPTDGEYFVAVRDVRDFSGKDFAYQLSVNAPRPRFDARVTSMNPKVAAGAGRRISFEIERIDGFDGEVVLEISDLPEGFSATSPIVVEPGHLRAWGTIMAEDDAKAPTEMESKKAKVTASAQINGTTVRKDLGSLGEIKLEEKAKVKTIIIPDSSTDPAILEVIPGQTVTVTLSIERNNHEGLVNYGKEDAMVNSPHGVYVANSGLNGVLIPPQHNQRTVFITAEPWVKPSERWVFVESSVSNNPTSVPIKMRVVDRQE